MTCPACGAALTADHVFCPRCGSRVPGAAAEAPASRTDTAVLLGRALGASYEVGAMIGRGGFGEVYAAEDRSLHRTVAVKVLRADVADSRTAIDRFRREAESLARLRHPHIMPVFGIGEGEGLTYFVMPRIEGESLADLLGRGEQLPLFDACRVIAETADALAAAHRAGVVHRDIKPDNILLEGEERHALLMDFGIAKSGGAEGRLTATGMIIGTPMYMSPEQASGDHTGPASDIYSFGVVAYELLAGRPIFGSATSPQQVVAAHLAQAPEDLRAANPAIPAAIAKAVMRCLRKDPADRWPAVEEFVRVFNQARADLPREPEVVIPEAPPALSKRGRLAVAALGVIGLVTTFAVYSTAVPSLDTPRTSREVALAEAESILTVMGLPRYREQAWRYLGGVRLGRSLEERRGDLGPGSPSLSRIALGEWHFAFFTKGAPGYVRVTMGGPEWASGFERKLDSATARLTSADTGLAVPLAALLHALGWDPDSLRPVDSTRTLDEGRVQRTYSWVPIGVLARGADTVVRQVSMTLSGGVLTSYRTADAPSAAIRARYTRQSTYEDSVRFLVFLVPTIVGVAGLVVARRRRALRWERALRVAAVATPLVAVSMAIFVSPQLSGSAAFGWQFAPEGAGPASRLLGLVEFAAPILVYGLLLLPIGALIHVAFEALTLGPAPWMLAGFRVFTSRPTLWRLLRPLPVGTALGLGVAAAGALIAMTTARLGAVPILASQHWTQSPLDSAAEILLLLGLALPIVTLSGQLLLHMRAVGRLQAAVPGALVIGLFVGLVPAMFQARLQEVALWGAIGTGAALVVATRGLLEGAVGLVAAWLAVHTAEVWHAPYSDPWPVTIALGLLVSAAVAGALVPAKPARGSGSQASAAP